MPACFERTGLAEGLEEPIQEDLRLALFIARGVFGTPVGEFGEPFPARHGAVLHGSGGGGIAEGWVGAQF